MTEKLHCFIGLGGNLGDRFANLQRALKMLEATEGLDIKGVSPVYESPAWGYSSDHLYLNAVAEVTWDGPPLTLEEQCYRIEAALGRHGAGANEARLYQDRVIDLDLLHIDGVKSDDERLKLPHPRAHLRAFVLLPLQKLAPDLVLNGRPLAKWISDLPEADLAVTSVWPDHILTTAE